MAKKMRICKICGKEYEYCGHCPGKNPIEPWRNLYCSENCHKAFDLFDKYISKKITSTEAKSALEEMGFVPAKVREIHKSVISEIFKNGAKVVAVSTVENSVPSEVDKVIDAITPVFEIKVGEPATIEPPKVFEEKKPQKNFKPKPKFVNEKKD